MPTPAPRPVFSALCDISLLDAEGTAIAVGSRVEQIAVDEAHGALRSRLHRQGEVIGRGRRLVYVRFAREGYLTGLRSHLVRLVPAPDGHFQAITASEGGTP
jgi:hypothetical protein